jgi:hypothetical protein
MNAESLLSQIRSLPNVTSAEITDYPGFQRIQVEVTPSYQGEDPNAGYTADFTTATDNPISALLGEVVSAEMSSGGDGEVWSFRMPE